MKSTKKQHFIPRVVLKQHICRSIPAPPNHIFQYNKDTGKEHLTGIDNICCAKYLYEIKESDGSINKKHLNKIEKHLSDIEGKLGKAIRNIRLDSFSDTDLAVIRFYTALQIIRVPNILELAKKLAKEMLDFDEYTAENFAKATGLLPGVISRDESILFDGVLRKVCSKHLKIFTTQISLCINESNPVLPIVAVLGEATSDDTSYFFPITHNICIGLLSTDTFEGKIKIPIPDVYTRYLNSLAYIANGKNLYCSVSVKENMKSLFLKMEPIDTAKNHHGRQCLCML